MSPNVYDQAHMLAAGVKASTEYADYRLALARLKAEPGTLRIFRDFRKRQFDLQSRLLQGQDVPEAERERFTQLSEIIAQHGPISAFLGAEFRLSRLLGDIQRIISDAVELEIGLEPDEESPEDEAVGNEGPVHEAAEDERPADEPEARSPAEAGPLQTHEDRDRAETPPPKSAEAIPPRPEDKPSADATNP